MMRGRAFGAGVIQRDEPDLQKKEEHLKEFENRCKQYKAIAPEFIELFKKYVECLVAGNKEEGLPLFQKVIDYLHSIRAFEIPADVFNEVENPDEAAEQYTSNVNLWSKTNNIMPGEKAKASGGITLESTLAGTLFNGLDFGVNYFTSDLLANQWKQVSYNYVKNAKGTVTAHLLIGVNKESVLYKTEADVVKKKLETGEVKSVVVRYYKARAEGGDIHLEEFKTEVVSTAEQWEKLLAQTKSTVPVGEIDTPTGKKQVVVKVDPNGRVFKAIQGYAHASEARRGKGHR